MINILIKLIPIRLVLVLTIFFVVLEFLTGAVSQIAMETLEQLIYEAVGL